MRTLRIDIRGNFEKNSPQSFRAENAPKASVKLIYRYSPKMARNEVCAHQVI